MRVDDQAKRTQLLSEIIKNRLNVSASEAYIENQISVFPAQTPDYNSSHKSAQEPNKKKKLDEIVSGIRKKVDNWSDIGEKADIDIVNRPDYIEINIKLRK